MTPLNKLRYRHYCFWQKVLSIFPVYRDQEKHANRWCFVEMQVLGISASEGECSPWVVRYKADGRVCIEEGRTLVHAIERAMAHAEFAERTAHLHEQVEAYKQRRDAALNDAREGQ